MTVQRITSNISMVAGVILIAVSAYYSYQYTREIQQEIRTKQDSLDALETHIETLQKEYELLVSGPLEQLVSPQAMLVTIEGKKDQFSRQLHDFNLWLNIPNNRKNDIQRVEYIRRNGEVLQKTLVGTEPSNGFGVSYLGWGCFTQVDVSIYEKSGNITQFSFDQCDQLD